MQGAGRRNYEGTLGNSGEKRDDYVHYFDCSGIFIDMSKLCKLYFKHNLLYANYTSVKLFIKK